MSHYDVVPAPNSTADRWTHPAFSGYNDGTYIWGRGSVDDKTLLVAQCMSSSLMQSQLTKRGGNNPSARKRLQAQEDLDLLSWFRRGRSFR
jgi:hypothetical protein